MCVCVCVCVCETHCSRCLQAPWLQLSLTREKGKERAGVRLTLSSMKVSAPRTAMDSKHRRIEKVTCVFAIHVLINSTSTAFLYSGKFSRGKILIYMYLT